MPGLLNMHRSESSDTMLRGESSEQSIVAVMGRFVQAVNAMDETVMIPMRLKDLPDETLKTQKPNGYKEENPDMYEYYYMLNAIKKELVSGPRSRTDTEGDDLVMTLKTIPRSQVKGRRRAHKKRNSLGQSDSECSVGDSTMSSDSELAPSSISDESESEEPVRMLTGSDASTDVTTEDDDASSADPANDTAMLFRHHLQGLYGILKNLTDNAQKVTNKYQEGIGGVGGGSALSPLPSFTL